MAKFLKDGGAMTPYLDGRLNPAGIVRFIWLSAMVCLPSAIDNTETNKFVQYKSF
jgi:hypothetical protein